MDGDQRNERSQPDDAFLPGLLGRSRLQWVLLALLAALLVVDGIVWHGLLFDSRIWHALLWVLVPGGLVIGGLAYWRRER